MIIYFYGGLLMDIEELKQNELNQLTNNDLEMFDLENLITDGANARIPLEVNFPVYKDGKMTTKKYGVIIRPITSAELNNATKIGIKDNNSDVNTEVVKKGLLTKNNENYPAEIVEKLPVGVINELATKICEVSGIQQTDQDNSKLIKEMMGF